MAKYLIVIFLIAFMNTPARAELSLGANTTENFLAACKNGESEDPLVQYKFLYCHGYLAGVIDNTTLLFATQPQSRFFCPPEQGLSSESLYKIIEAYTITKPESLKESARMTVYIAYALAFPCKE